jgi:tetratricopeptide (TPR) repeat protein
MLFKSRSIIDMAGIIKRTVVLTFLLSGLQSVSVASEGDAGFSCEAATGGSAAEQQKAAVELLNHTYDTSKLACGTQVLTRIADEATGDYDTQLAALHANATYIYYLDRIVLYELGYLISWYVTEVPMETKLNAPMIALMAAREEHLRLLKQARDAGFDTAELDYYEGLSLGPVANALPILKDVVAKDPKNLYGAAHALLAETYYVLPDLVGGDLDLAITSMQAAVDRAPGNPRYARLLAGYLLDIDKTDEATTILKRIMSMESGMAGWQLQADQLRIAAGLAERIGDKGLAEQLTKQREVTLKAHPMLQTRTVVSAMGHFGDKDPMADPDQEK